MVDIPYDPYAGNAGLADASPSQQADAGELPFALRTPTAFIAGLSRHVDSYPDAMHELRATKTEYPLESGAVVSDHLVVRPARLVLTGFVSDLLIASPATAADRNAHTRGRTAWDAVRALAAAGELIPEVITSIGAYRDMAVVGANAEVSARTGGALRFRLELEEMQVRLKRLGIPLPLASGVADPAGEAHSQWVEDLRETNRLRLLQGRDPVPFLGGYLPAPAGLERRVARRDDDSPLALVRAQAQPDRAASLVGGGAGVDELEQHDRHTQFAEHLATELSGVEDYDAGDVDALEQPVRLPVTYDLRQRFEFGVRTRIPGDAFRGDQTILFEVELMLMEWQSGDRRGQSRWCIKASRRDPSAERLQARREGGGDVDPTGLVPLTNPLVRDVQTGVPLLTTSKGRLGQIVALPLASTGYDDGTRVPGERVTTWFEPPLNAERQPGRRGETQLRLQRAAQARREGGPRHLVGLYYLTPRLIGSLLSELA